MGNKSFPRHGIAKWPRFSFINHPESYRKISEKLNIYFLSSSVLVLDFPDFFRRIELAISYVLFMKELPESYSRKEVLSAVEAITLEEFARDKQRVSKTETVQKAISYIENQTPQPIRSWLYTKDISLLKAKSLPEVVKALRQIKIKARNEMSKPGPNHDQALAILAKEIDLALRANGVKCLSISRPIETKSDASIYGFIVKECFSLSGVNISDPSYYLRFVSS